MGFIPLLIGAIASSFPALTLIPPSAACGRGGGIEFARFDLSLNLVRHPSEIVSHKKGSFFCGPSPVLARTLLTLVQAVPERGMYESHSDSDNSTVVAKKTVSHRMGDPQKCLIDS